MDWPRWLGLFLGLVLLAASVIIVVQRRQSLSAATAALADPAPVLLLLLAGAVAVNVMLSGALFSVLMARYGRVGRLEMQALVAASTVLNYLPLRAGLFGRVAYHKTVNRISPMDSGKAVIQAAAISAGLAGYGALAVFAATRAGTRQAAILIALVSLPPALGAAGCVAWRGLEARRWAAAVLIRSLEIIVWSVRYAVAFALVGSPIPWSAAVAFACISTIATMVPFSSNGLGLREWAVGASATLLTSYQLELGVTAELVNRAAELVVVAVMGSAGLVHLAMRRRAAR